VTDQSQAKILENISSPNSALHDQENKQPIFANLLQIQCHMSANCGIESFTYKSRLDLNTINGPVEFSFTPKGFNPIRIQFSIQYIQSLGFIGYPSDIFTATDNGNALKRYFSGGALSFGSTNLHASPTSPTKMEEGEGHFENNRKRPLSPETNTRETRQKQ
jgi:hypothetical protein